jgi:hypothetical protein
MQAGQQAASGFQVRGVEPFGKGQVLVALFAS